MTGDPIVLKIGGSLARRRELLGRVLSVVGNARRGIAVVPGGGDFADVVRRAQHRFGFDDVAAHRMAILGMHQMGLMLAAMSPRLRTCEDLQDVRDGLRCGEAIVWLPLKECDGDPDLPQTWEATSDAIAARLAQRLGGVKVVFVKSRAACGASTVSALAADGLIDKVAAAIIDDAGLAFDVIVADDDAGLCKLLGVSMPVDVPPTTC